MPVDRPVMMSVIAIARGWNPFALNHCTILSLPADVHNFTLFRSSTVCTGFLVNTCAQPSCPQFSSMKPLASARLRISGVNFSVT